MKPLIGKTILLAAVTFNAKAAALPYEVVRPEAPGSHRALLIALPGAGESPRFYCDIFSGGQYRKLARERGYVLACLSSYSLGMRYENHEDQVLAVRDELVRKYPSIQKVFLTGYSVGGRGALMIAMRHPDKFDGVAAVVPWFRLPGDNTRAFPELTGRIAGYPHDVFIVSAVFDFFFPYSREKMARFAASGEGHVNRKRYPTDHWFVVMASAKDLFDFFDRQTNRKDDTGRLVAASR